MSSRASHHPRTDADAIDFESVTRADKLHLLFVQSFPAVFISLANAGLLVYVLWSGVGHRKLWIWFAAVIAASAVRTALFVSYRVRAPSGLAVLKWEAPYFATLVGSALVWGVGGLWLIATSSAADQLVIFFFLMGMAGGAISVYSPIRPMVLAAVASVLVPVTAWFLVFGEAALHAVAMGSALFLGSCLRSTKVLSNALHQSFMLGHKLSYANAQAESLARTDYLTGLNNRGAFHDQVGTQLSHCDRHGFPVSLIVLDLDDFKHINDTYGHGTGDQVLRQVSALMRRNTRASDVCGRMGGEEFMVFLPNTVIDDAVAVAEKIRRALEENPLDIEQRPLSITASFGVASGLYDLERLQVMADRALYRAKRAGKNRVDAHPETAAQ